MMEPSRRRTWKVLLTVFEELSALDDGTMDQKMLYAPPDAGKRLCKVPRLKKFLGEVCPRTSLVPPAFPSTPLPP